MSKKTVCVDDYIVSLKIKTKTIEEPKCSTFHTFNGNNKLSCDTIAKIPPCKKCSQPSKKKPCRRPKRCYC